MYLFIYLFLVALGLRCYTRALSVLFFGPIAQVKAGEKVSVIMCLLSTVCVLFKGVTV